MQAPSHLPIPIDDGACEHLPGIEMPSQLLPSTAGRLIDLSKRDAARTVVYCYSMMGVPGAPLPEGDPGSARLHTISLRVSRPLPGTRHV